MGLEIRYTVTPYRGFKSLPFRQISKTYAVFVTPENHPNFSHCDKIVTDGSKTSATISAFSSHAGNAPGFVFQFVKELLRLLAVAGSSSASNAFSVRRCEAGPVNRASFVKCHDSFLSGTGKLFSLSHCRNSFSTSDARNAHARQNFRPCSFPSCTSFLTVCS